MTAVSVVIPAHRLDHWLDEAVASVLDSTGSAPEVVVVLNGIADVESRDWMGSPRLILLHSAESLGPTRAMIRGVQAATGDFISRLDADDRMRPERIAVQLEYLASRPETPLVGTAVGRITERGEPAGAIRMPTGDDVRSHLVLSNTVTHSSVLMRRSALEAVGGYDPALAQMEDYDLILRLAQLGPIAVLADELTEYRLHPGQISKGARPTGAHIDKVLAERRQLGAAIGLSRAGVAARNALWRAAQFSRYWGITRPGHEY
ncbi:MAG: hypothetical protein BGN97_14660 [Microbacterium sp. 69-10]|uniref:glycosyltransferase family 2 protein n=1 Tax=Microbacterium sp. 69-10 TaxID=1895783 RepID=UPI00095B504B|nr:glycosyltransferase [Microbacterium sp. 69-10]OJU40033.1 MAG: hypothetical protein BGN97_14660 [Microbacterium sp. 69-10]